MITVNSNGEAITGTLNGKAFGIPFKKDWLEKLTAKAKEANSAKTADESKLLHTSFQNSLNAMKGASKGKQIEQEVKVGTTGLSVKENPDGVKSQYYLHNGKAFSKFYIPTPLYKRIEETLSKGLDVTPLYKFFARALRNPVMTQEKLGRLVDYIEKTFIDQDVVNDLIEQGMTREEAVKHATMRQVSITEEGLLNTYKVSTLIGENGVDSLDYEDELDEEEDLDDEDEDEDDTSAEDVLDLFKFVPVRNSKGHFLKRGSDEYVQAYNTQLDAFKQSKGLTVAKTQVKSAKGNTKVVEANSKTVESYVFQPAYQGKSGDAFYCGAELGHKIQVGKVHYLPNWSQVNTNDNSSALPGLHVGGRDYIRGYENNVTDQIGTSIVHNIFVDPQHIGAIVAVEHGDGAMRVKQYFVHSSLLDAVQSGLYNSSDYAKQTDEEWDAQLNEAMQIVKEADAKIEQIKKDAAAAQKVVDQAF